MLSPLQSFSHVIDWPSFLQAQAAKVQDARLHAFYTAPFDVECTLDQARFMALDIETTGLDTAVDDIVSLGIVPFTVKTIFCKKAHHWIFKPVQPLGEESVVIHQITHSDVAHKPDIEEKLDELLGLLHGHIVVVHCLDIERNFLYNAIMKRVGEELVFPMIDTMAIEQEVLKKQQTFFDKLRRKALPAVRLAACRARYNLPDYRSHHALHDALATAELFQAQVAHHLGSERMVTQLLR